MTDQVPRPDIADDVHRVTRATLSTIPGLGGPIVEIFNRLLAPPIQRRRDAWLNGLAERVAKLEQEGRVSIDDLQQDEEFVSTVMHASQAAARNHQQEKIDALRNAVLNTALGEAPEDSKREMFLRFVDEFSVWHLRLLSLLADPPGWFEQRNKDIPQPGITGSVHQVIQSGMPELTAESDFLEVIGQDLHASKLTRTDSFKTMMTPQEMTQKQTTDLGDEFLRFIAAPREPG